MKREFMVQRGGRLPLLNDGCELHAHCLSCPLPRCQYDEPLYAQNTERADRDAAIAAAVEAEGLTIAAAVQRFQMSRRSINRALSGSRARRKG